MPAMDYEQVAQFYDAYVQTDFDVAFFLKEAKGARRVMELTSGTGRLSIPLIEAGVPLTCVDLSPEMLARLRAKLDARGLRADVYEMDVRRLSLPNRFDLIIFPFHSFSELTAIADQREALAAIRRHLAVNGRFVCTFHNPTVRLKGVTGERRELGTFDLPDGPRTVTVASVGSPEPGSQIVRGQQFYLVRDEHGHASPEIAVDLAFYVHERDEFEALARTAGFRVANLYGDYASSPFDPNSSSYMIFVLEVR